MAEWLDDFFWRSMLAGLIMISVSAPMGCLMVWQRLAFLSDTLGHAAVLGVGLGLFFDIMPIFGVLGIALLIVVALSRVGEVNVAYSETTLAIISHTGLAGGIILTGLLPARDADLEGILFGDLLATSREDLAVLALTTALLMGLLLRYWRAFVAISVSREIAQAEGVEVRRMQLLMYVMVALLVAVMMKVMGVLLIAAMLVIPSTSARLLSHGPEQMVLISALYGFTALAGGIASSYRFDWQTGPAIVVSAAALLLATLAFRGLLRQRGQ